MPTKDERITNLEKEVESLREQLKYCKMAAERSGKPVDIPLLELAQKTQATETASPKPQPEGQSETKEAKV